jgi:hypothetical protein
MGHKLDSFHIPRPAWQCLPLHIRGQPMSPMSPYPELGKQTAEEFQVRLTTLI